MSFFAKASGKSGEIFIYEDIGGGWFGGITAKSFSDEISKVGDVSDLNIFINSPGGSVFEGISIYNQILRHKAKKKTTYIDGIAASIASIIALAGDTVKIASNGTYMIHDPWTMSMGSAVDLRKAADVMDSLRETLLDTYVARTSADKATISKMMTDETWMNAEQALKHKFVHEITEAKSVQNSFTMLAKFKATPKNLLEQSKNPLAQIAHMEMRIDKFNRAGSVAA